MFFGEMKTESSLGGILSSSIEIYKDKKKLKISKGTVINKNLVDLFLLNNINHLVCAKLDNDEVEEEKLISTSSETFGLFNKEVSWREDANKNLLPELMKYNEVIKNNIGLRRQSKLTKEQAKFVARCNSVHRDVSLNF